MAQLDRVVHQAAVALFTIGTAALESGELPADDVIMLVQALTTPAKLQEVSAALSPHLTPRCAARFIGCPASVSPRCVPAASRV